MQNFLRNERPSFSDRYRFLRRVRERVPRSLMLVARDRFLWALVIIALVVNLGLFAFLIIQFNSLPPLVPLHFDAGGDPDRIEPASALFSLPQIGMIVIAGNFALGALMYRRERLATYLLVGTAIAIQFLLWFAAIAIVRVVALG